MLCPLYLLNLIEITVIRDSNCLQVVELSKFNSLHSLIHSSWTIVIVRGTEFTFLVQLISTLLIFSNTCLAFLPLSR